MEAETTKEIKIESVELVHGTKKLSVRLMKPTPKARVAFAKVKNVYYDDLQELAKKYYDVEEYIATKEAVKKVDFYAPDKYRETKEWRRYFERDAEENEIVAKFILNAFKAVTECEIKDEEILNATLNSPIDSDFWQSQNFKDMSEAVGFFRKEVGM